MESSVLILFNGLADYQHIPVFPLLYYLSPSSPGTVFMLSAVDSAFIGLCLEGFFYGNISVLCALTCTFAKEVQIFPDLGLYSGIFAIYLQCHLKESRTGTIVFYVLCLLYVLSVATVISDLISVMLQVSNNSICKNIIFNRLCRHVSVHYHLNFKLTTSHHYFALGLSKSR